MRKSFPFYKQPDAKDCGPTCIKIVAKFYIRHIALPQIRQLSQTTREGSSLLSLSDAAEQIGFKTLGVKLNVARLQEAPLPCIVHWNKNHFAVLYKIKKGIFYISDPAHGLINYNQHEFLTHWIGNNANEETQEGIALLLEPTAKFFLSPTLSKGKGDDLETNLSFGFFI